MGERKVSSSALQRHKQALVLRSIVLLPMLLGWLATPAAIWACGMPLDAQIPSEQALIIFSGGREEIIPSLQLQSDKPGAAVIFPVPSEPTISAGPSENLFTYLADVTRPEERTEERLIWRDQGETAGAGAPGGVQVLGHEIIGGYSVARLEADDAAALQRWLDENGYRAPESAAPILGSYIDAGWKFVAVKLAPGEQVAGALKPLRIAFDTPEIVYPMRLSALAEQPLDVLLYVLADRRVEIAAMETQYAGLVADLDQTPPAELAPLFTAPYLTKLRNSAIAPASLTKDYLAQPAPTNEPFRMVRVRTVFISGWDRMALPIAGLVLVILSSSVALGIAFNLRRRIDRIAGPDPEKEDD
jgi:hypothetical protein